MALPDEESADSPALGDRRWRTLGIPILLFILTFLSVTLSGALQQPLALAAPDLRSAAAQAVAHFASGLPYAFALLAILMAHEAGHAIAARVHGVPASMPHFLPLPFSAVGTMGAVINLRGEVRSRNALIDIAAAGPLAGLVVAIPVLALGIHLSPVGPSHSGDSVEGQSLLYLLIKFLVKGELLPFHGRDVQLHPVAFAGWVGLLVTVINLIPIGPLDGGHIAAAALGPGHDRRSRLVHRLLPVVGLVVAAAIALVAVRAGQGRRALSLGLQAGAPWLVWSGGLLLLRRLQGGRWIEPLGADPLTPGRRMLVGLVTVVFVLLFMPWVMREAL